MTKEQYFETCELLGTEPVESEIPIEYEDLLVDVQEGLSLYNMLQDKWDGMSGEYLGKNLSVLPTLFEVLEVQDRKTALFIILLIDIERSAVIKNKKPSK